ncbi:MAG TPA: hypothetical protein VGJ70_10285, partial [Solirubrobacteraceae bacterium]
ARRAEGVLNVHVYRAPGQRLGPLRTGADRVGAVLTVGPTREDAMRRAVAAAGYIRFETSDAEAFV